MIFHLKEGIISFKRNFPQSEGKRQDGYASILASILFVVYHKMILVNALRYLDTNKSIYLDVRGHHSKNQV